MVPLHHVPDPHTSAPLSADGDADLPHNLIDCWRAVLSDKQRAVIDHWNRGSPYQEIALLLGLTVKTVNTHLERAKAKLRILAERERERERKALIARLLEVLARYPALRLAMLSGSGGRGRRRFHSDVDRAADAGHPLDSADRANLIEALAEATSGRRNGVETLGPPLPTP